MYTVVVEFYLDGKLITQSLDVLADSEQDARDAAYSRIKRENPDAKHIDILTVFDSNAA